ncbi:MAG: type IVB secretion system protein IcmM/DotJ [Legionellales bacterium]
MNRETWTLIKRNKNFNVNVYRRGLIALDLSLLLSCIFVLLLFYKYINLPERDFYATSGITAPVKLKALSVRNLSSVALLEQDPPLGNLTRNIPQ